MKEKIAKPDNVKDLYNQIAKKYNQNRSLVSNDVTELPKIIELAGDVRGKNILDLGCGIGKHAKAYLEKGAKVTGVDASEEMLKIAKKTCGDKGKFFVANFEEVEFDQGSFDLISASFSIHYSNKLDYLFKQFYSWLKPNGRVIFSIFHPIQYYIRLENFDFSKSGKYWFNFKTHEIDLYTYYHPVGEYCESFLSNGFELKSLCETTIPRELEGWAERKYRIPNAMIFEILKK